MPTINGIKMACAPCIRGHRSTKCNHADERLMVPVRKPGRPLSSCPHPQDQACGCGSVSTVTAAIPRKQQCGCGSASHREGHEGHNTDHTTKATSVQTNPHPPTIASETPRTSAGPSPTMKATPNPKLQKPSRPQAAGRRQSYDMEKAGTSESEVKIVHTFDVKQPYSNPQSFVPSFEQPTRMMESGSMGWKLSEPKMDSFVGLDVDRRSDFNIIPPLVNGNGHISNGGITTPPMDVESKYGPFGIVSPPQQFQGYTRQLLQQPNGVVIETRIHNVGPNGIANLNGHWVPHYNEEMVMPTIPHPAPQSQPLNGGGRSCCSSSRKRSREESPAPPESSNEGSCCASKRSKSMSHSSTTPPSHLTPSQSPRLTPMTNHTNHMAGNFPDFIGPPGSFGYMQQPGLNGMVYPTVFAYPPTYGSYQHPLQPAQWRQGVQYNTYAHMMSATPAPPSQVQGTMGDSSDTLHACGCGDGCECVGCAAHPYNEATQNYVRSAWEIGASLEPHHRASQSSSSLPEAYQPPNSASTAPKRNGSHNINNIHIKTNGNALPQNGSVPQASSPADTPSDAAGDDPPLSASDFFFVNYPFNEGCGGDMVSCPCGDDCACLGCSIHNGDADPLGEGMPNGDHNSDSGPNLGNGNIVKLTNGEQAPKISRGSCCGGGANASRNDGGIGHREDESDEGVSRIQDRDGDGSGEVIAGFDRSINTDFADMCGGDERTCPCPPDGCECIGCTIHGRP